MTYQPGDILLDKYRIEELIGRGAFAEVYRATHLELDRPRALKILRKDSKEVGSSTYHDYEQRFGLEAKLGDRLDHPNLIQVYDFDREGNDLVLVMEYAPGGNLAEKIQAARDHGEFIPIEEIKRIAIDISQGLAEIHELDIVHRDLKPSNIVFDKDGRVKIADLGLAQTPESRIARELTGSIGFDQPGTLEYMPPEQRPGNKMPVKASADIYALGCVIFEMLTRRVYYQQRPGTKPRSLRSDVPPWIDKLVMKMLSDDPASRPWDGNELIKALKKGAGVPKLLWIFPAIAFLSIVIIVLGGQFMRRDLEVIDISTPTNTITIDSTSTPSPTYPNTSTSTTISPATATPTPTITNTPSFTSSPTPIELDPFILNSDEFLSPGETPLFIEDFQDGKESFSDLKGNWSIIDDPLEPGNKVYQLDTTGLTETSLAYLGVSASDFIAQYRVRFYQHSFPDTGRNFVSFSNWRDGYIYTIFMPSSVYSRDRFEGTEFMSTYIELESDRWYTMRLEVNGQTADYYLDGVQLSRYNQVKPEMGEGGFNFAIGEGSEIVHLDDIIIIAPSVDDQSATDAEAALESTVTKPEETTLFEEDFEDGEFSLMNPLTSGWNVVNDGTGNLVLESGGIASDKWFHIEFPPEGFSTGNIEFRIKLLDYDHTYEHGGSASLQFWAKNWGENHYDLLIQPYYNEFVLAYSGAYLSGIWESKDSFTINWDQNVWYSVRVEFLGDKMNAYINDVLVIQGKLDILEPKGYLALNVDAKAFIQYDDFRVSSIEQ